ncbi:ComEA family DNA-binding protein [Trueperella bialowiezensis]|uniref:ComE operon protein 1 n=1 Tax=Trueperella bialowiezensis TaxID=312285 RepID=A0A3S4VHC3_9ACTO|nr:ComEA family DNA-binding protein [Trueperella bialowiezensis]VEI14089.1 ComE operon protein 1 [Trueperella bialowiezensis]
MTSPPPRRTPTRRSPRVRHNGGQWGKAQSFARQALRAGAGDDVGSLTTSATAEAEPVRRRFVLDGRSLRLVAIFLTVLTLSAIIAALSSRSVNVSAIPPKDESQTAPVRVEATPDPATSETSNAPGSESDGEASSSEVVVHVSGAVRSPGVVTLQGAVRVVDAVDAAGGASDDADLSAINLAQRIEDGSHVHVPAQGEAGPGGVVSGSATDHGQGTDGAGNAGGSAGKEKVNVNTASQAELETIPGIGPVTAQAIIAWRDEHGNFRSVDELTEVSGIGPKTLERLRDHVRVS